MATIDWTPVEEAEAEKTLSGYKLALLEAVKILEDRLKQERIPGRSPAERLGAAELHFTRPRDVERAYNYVVKLREGTTGGLTQERAKTYLQAIKQAVADLNDLSQTRSSLTSQVKIYLGLLKGKQRWLTSGLAAVAIFFVTVLILADTAPGQVFVAGVVGLVHLFFKWIIALILILGLAVLAVLGTAIYLDRRTPGGTVRGEDEE